MPRELKYYTVTIVPLSLPVCCASHQHGITVIIVLMYWGFENRYFPDETALTIARHLAQLKVTLVIGHHPFVVQGHSYFGNTLVLFSLGKLITTSEQTSFCWQMVSIITPNVCISEICHFVV